MDVNLIRASGMLACYLDTTSPEDILKDASGVVTNHFQRDISVDELKHVLELSHRCRAFREKMMSSIDKSFNADGSQVMFVQLNSYFLSVFTLLSQEHTIEGITDISVDRLNEIVVLWDFLNIQKYTLSGASLAIISRALRMDPEHWQAMNYCPFLKDCIDGNLKYLSPLLLSMHEHISVYIDGRVSENQMKENLQEIEKALVLPLKKEVIQKYKFLSQITGLHALSLPAAALMGNLQGLTELWNEECSMPKSELLWMAVNSGSLKCTQFIHNQGVPFDPKIMNSMANVGDIPTLEWVHKTLGMPLTVSMMKEARRNLETVKWLYQHGCPWTGEITCFCVEAASSGSVDCFAFAREHGCPVGQNTFLFVFYSRGPNIQKMIIHLLEINEPFPIGWTDKKLVKTVCKFGALQVLRYLHQKGRTGPHRDLIQKWYHESRNHPSVKISTLFQPMVDLMTEMGID